MSLTRGLHLYVGSKRYSSWSLRPYLALAHAAAEFECTTILFDQPDTKAKIAKANPAAKVPVLHHDGKVIWDSLAICEYVNELYPNAKLWPTDRDQRAKARSVSSEMHSGFVALRRDMPMDVCSKKPGTGHTAEAIADGRRVMEIWRDQLSASRGPFLFGTFTIADAMFAPVTTRFTTYGVELDAVCRAYVDAVAALPAMKQWCADAAAEPDTRRENTGAVSK
ncbi:MAG: glutathione S-transferase [Myxococcales bacterium]|nr:glutathione S-transferase [Myxococcales bacterium]